MWMNDSMIRKVGFWFLASLLLAVTAMGSFGVGQAQAEILLSDDFEDFAYSDNLWGFKNTSANSPYRIVFDSAKAHSGNGVLELRYEPGTTGPGFETGGLSRPAGEFYYRWYEKWSSNWQWGGVAVKNIKLQGGGPSYSYIVKWASGRLEIGIENAEFSSSDLFQNIGTPVQFQGDQWYCLETYVKQDTGNGDGAVKLWIDGDLKIDVSSLSLSSTYNPINQAMISGYYNRGGSTPNGVPQLQYAWHDDHVASTQRIGCMGTTQSLSFSELCQRGDILVCEDWETGRDGWDWNNNWDPVTRGEVKCGSTLQGTGTTAFEGNCAIHLRFEQNAADAVYPSHAISPQTGNVYARFHIKYSQGYQWNAPGSKVFYLRSSANGSFSWAAQLGSKPEDSANLQGPGKFYMDLQTHRLMLGYNKGLPEDGRIYTGQWHEVEMMAKPNTLGQSDGAVKLWINGKLVMDYTGLDLRAHAVDPTSPINRVWISAYIGGPTNPHPGQDMWYDNIISSPNRIGSGSAPPPDAVPLSAPRGLRIK